MSTGPAASLFASLVEHRSNAQFITPLAASRKVQARHEDAFGLVKIPRYEALNSTARDGGWKEVPSDLNPEDYSALVGLDVVGLPPDRESLFTLESSYLSTVCQRFIQVPYPQNRTRQFMLKIASLMNYNFTSLARAGLMPLDRLDDGKDRFRTFLFDVDHRQALHRMKAYLSPEYLSAHDGDAELTSPRRLVFAVVFRSTDHGDFLNLANCTLHETHVEAAVSCHTERDGGGCRVQDLRLSLDDRKPQSLTMFDNALLARTFSKYVPSFMYGTPQAPSMLEAYIATGNPMTPVNMGRKSLAAFKSWDLSKVTARTFSERLSLFLNTFYLAQLAGNKDTPVSSLAQYDNVTTPSRDFSVFGEPSLDMLRSDDGFWQYIEDTGAAMINATLDGLPFIPAATMTAARKVSPMYVCRFAWMAALLLASAALLVMGVTSLALQLRCTLAPDVLRYVSSMTYANAHFRTPPGGTTLDGVERAKLLRDVRVRISDIRGDDDDVGEVAFVAMDDAETRELERKRHYA
jgi:hypothetical protein